MEDNKQRKRRYRSPHPGVKIRKRYWTKTKVTSYSAIFTDPDTGRQHSVSLTELGLSNEEQRKQWAIKKSREIQRRKEELELGAPRRSQTEIEKAVDRFLDDKRMETRAKTMEVYGESLARFKHWAKLAKLPFVEHLAPQHLAHLRTYLVGLAKRDAAKGGKRGQRRDSPERRSPYSINRDIRSIKTMFNYWRRRDLTPLLNSDHLADRLQFVKEPKNLKTVLMQDDLAKLLQACHRHDAEKFAETRQEHAGLAPVGSTPRYFQVTPFLLTVLLTGCRVGEVRGGPADVAAQDEQRRGLIVVAGTAQRGLERVGVVGDVAELVDVPAVALEPPGDIVGVRQVGLAVDGDVVVVVDVDQAAEAEVPGERRHLVADALGEVAVASPDQAFGGSRRRPR